MSVPVEERPDKVARVVEGEHHGAGGVPCTGGRDHGSALRGDNAHQIAPMGFLQSTLYRVLARGNEDRLIATFLLGAVIPVSGHKYYQQPTAFPIPYIQHIDKESVRAHQRGMTSSLA